MRIDCPLHESEAYHVTIPSKWLGKHYYAYLDAMDAAKDAKGIVKKFIVSISICDDYHLPGLTGKYENWDLKECDLQLMAWVSQSVFDDFLKCFEVPKKKSLNTGDILNQVLMSGMTQMPA